MGASASVISLPSLTPQQVGDMVANLGAAYEPYKARLISDGISGDVLMSLSDSDMKDMLKGLGIENVVHVKVLISHFNKLKAENSTVHGGNAGGVQTGNDPDCCKYYALPSDFQVGEKITKTPRNTMTKLFEIQGIPVDPTDLDTAVEKIAKAVGSGFGDGKEKYDCFINYRVASDADLAEKLYLYLRTKSIYAFLDKKCLKNGEKWKDGFLTGLKNSKCFLALISRNGLERVRDESADHTWDNVLLEYETALNIKDVTKNPKYICPLHVGQCDKGVLTKFIDFASSLYPDSIEAVKKPPPPTSAKVAASTPPVPPAAPPVPVHTNNNKIDESEDAQEEEEQEEADAGEEDQEAYHDHDDNNIGVCGVCDLALSLQPKGTWGDGWGCDWPGHEGPNYFRSSDPLYGCPTVKECNWGVCQACWENIQATMQQMADESKEEDEWEIVDQPEGTRSKYNDSYYCDVKKVSCKMDGETGFTCVVNYSVRGDMSLGALQSPKTSRLVIGGHKYTCDELKIYIQDMFQIQGDLIYHLSMDCLPDFVEKQVGFIFGESGYSTAQLVVPGSENNFCTLPTCSNGHTMTISDYAQGNYRYGYVCDNCRQGKRDLRWFCHPCSSDLCFNCQPIMPMQPVCNKGHKMERRTTNPKEYGGSARCDVCKRNNLPYDPEFYHCKDCKYDLCLKCTTQQVASAE